MNDQSDWIVFAEGEDNSKVSIVRKAGVYAVTSCSDCPDHSLVKAGCDAFRVKGNPKAVIKEILGVEIPNSRIPPRVTKVAVVG